MAPWVVVAPRGEPTPSPQVPSQRQFAAHPVPRTPQISPGGTLVTAAAPLGDTRSDPPGKRRRERGEHRPAPTGRSLPCGWKTSQPAAMATAASPPAHPARPHSSQQPLPPALIPICSRSPRGRAGGGDEGDNGGGAARTLPAPSWVTGAAAAPGPLGAQVTGAQPSLPGVQVPCPGRGVRCHRWSPRANSELLKASPGVSQNPNPPVWPGKGGQESGRPNRGDF